MFVFIACILYYEGILFPDRRPKKCIQPCPVAISTRVAAKKPIIAKRPFQISASGLIYRLILTNYMYGNKYFLICMSLHQNILNFMILKKGKYCF